MRAMASLRDDTPWGVLRTLVVVFENAGDRMLIFPDPSWAR
jgi:hypothetical protein